MSVRACHRGYALRNGREVTTKWSKLSSEATRSARPWIPSAACFFWRAFIVPSERSGDGQFEKAGATSRETRQAQRHRR